MEFGEIVRNARIASGMSQAELGQKMQRSRSHAAVSDIELGKVSPSQEDRKDLMTILAIPDLAVYTPYDLQQCAEKRAMAATRVNRLRSELESAEKELVFWTDLLTDMALRPPKEAQP